MIDKLGLYAKKYLFAALLIIVGIVLVIMALKPVPVIEKTQSSSFLIGSLSILIAGIITLLYVLELISKYIHLAIMTVLIVVCVILSVMSVRSLSDTMEKRKQFAKYEKEVIQSLDDIRTIQNAHKKVYGKYATDFKELHRFLTQDKVFRTIPQILHPSGAIPDRQPNAEEIAILGYDPFEDEAMIIDGIDESEAIKLGYLKIDTIWIPVLDQLFHGEEAQSSSDSRRFDFEESKLDIVRNTGDTLVHFVMRSVVIDSTTNAFTVYDPYAYNPFREEGQKRDTLRLGDLSDGSTNGSWEL